MFSLGYTVSGVELWTLDPLLEDRDGDKTDRSGENEKLVCSCDSWVYYQISNSRNSEMWLCGRCRCIVSQKDCKFVVGENRVLTMTIGHSDQCNELYANYISLECVVLKPSLDAGSLSQSYKYLYNPPALQYLIVPLSNSLSDDNPPKSRNEHAQ